MLVDVLYLKDVLYFQKEVLLEWQTLIGPAAIIAFAVALKLARFKEH